MSTYEKILPIVTEIYGDGIMAEGLAKQLAEKVEDFDPSEFDYHGDEQREDMIRLTCWNWFSGGGTAEIAAERIEEALR